MGLVFSELTPDYQPKIDEYLEKTKYITSDYCLASVLFFTEMKNIQVATDDIALYIKCELNDEIMFFSPLCEEKDFANAVARMKEFCYDNDAVLKFYSTKNNVIKLLESEGKTQSEIEELLSNQVFKTDKFCFENDRNSADYIYRPNNLIELAGGKYKSKRNEIKSFEKQYGGRYIIRDMQDGDLPGILSLVKVWHKFKEFSQNDEEERLTDIINNREKLHLGVVVMLVDDEIVATSIYSITKSNVGDEVFERCKPDFRNAYPIIARYVATKLQDCDYINFEEDMGIEGLRFSKKSYYPEFILEKFIVCENLESELKKIYQDIFGDSDEFTEEIFSEHSQCGNSSLDIDNGKVVACGFYRNKKLRIFQNIYEMPFLFAIGTDDRYRYQGRAKRIITRLLNTIKDNGYAFAALYPFPVARSFYEKMGFVTFNYVKEILLKDALLNGTEFRFEENPSAEKFVEVFNNSSKNYNLAQFRDIRDTEKMLNETRAYEGTILSFYYGETLYGYILMSEEGVEEIIIDFDFVKTYKSNEFDESVCSSEIKKYLNEKIQIAENSPFFELKDNTEYNPYIMIKPIDAYHFVKCFLPFLDCSDDYDANLMIKDEMIGNSIINLSINNYISSVHSSPNDEVLKYVELTSVELCEWALGIRAVDGLPKIKKTLVTTKYKDTY